MGHVIVKGNPSAALMSRKAVRYAFHSVFLLVLNGLSVSTVQSDSAKSRSRWFLTSADFDVKRLAISSELAEVTSQVVTHSPFSSVGLI